MALYLLVFKLSYRSLNKTGKQTDRQTNRRTDGHGL